MTDLYPDFPSRPRVFTVPAGLPFADAFAGGLLERVGPRHPWTLGRTRVLVSGRREVTLLRDVFRAKAGALFIPSRHAIRELARDPTLLTSARRPVGAQSRVLALARMVSAFHARTRAPVDGESLIELARALARLLDESYEEGLDPSVLGNCVPDSLAEHWQETAKFLDIIGSIWADWQKESDAEDPALSYRLAVEELIESWRANPPEAPVLVAGSTLTDDTACLLAEAIAHLPQGAVVLPGLDRDIEESAWNAIATGSGLAPEHPQYSMKRFLERLGVDRDAVLPWGGQPEPRPARVRFLAQALRPAPATSAWRSQAEVYDAIAIEAMAGVELVEADSADREAMVVALALREAMETRGLRASLVTEDVDLRSRVRAKCAMWGLDPAMSQGVRLAATVAGRFGLLAARVALEPPGFAPLLALLKNSVFLAGAGRERHLRRLNRVERILRGEVGRKPGIEGLRQAIGEGKNASGILEWLARIERGLEPLARHAGCDEVEFAALIEAHCRAIDALAGETAPGMGPLRGFLADLRTEATLLGGVSPRDYPDALAALMARDAGAVGARHPRVSIRGNLESRFDPPDLIILGGLNEEEAPGGRGDEGWLNRSMRQAIGMPSRQRDIGTIAHDFSILFAVPHVLLTRSRTVDEEPTVASRWLLRLTNLLDGSGPAGRQALASMKARGGARLDMAERLSRFEGKPRPAARPMPRPPADARPRRLSATAVETLIKDPYAIYARDILKLRPLERLGAKPDYRLRGTLAHQVMEQFAARSGAAVADQRAFAAMLKEAGESAFCGLSDWPWLGRLWRSRIEALYGWLSTSEVEDRKEGWTPAGAEVRGEMRLDDDLVLTARADRIDIRAPDRGAEGDEAAPIRYRVTDYKSGALPSPSDLASHALQLQIAALILEAGGFEGLEPGEVESTRYVGLRPDSNNPYQGKVVADPLEELEKFQSRLSAVLRGYASQETPYASHALPHALPHGGNYDHLARVAEWTSAGDGEDD